MLLLLLLLLFRLLLLLLTLFLVEVLLESLPLLPNPLELSLSSTTSDIAFDNDDDIDSHLKFMIMIYKYEEINNVSMILNIIDDSTIAIMATMMIVDLKEP